MTVAEGGSAKADLLKEGAISGLLETRPGLIRPGRVLVNRWLGLGLQGPSPVSYTHLTLPTIYSV